MNNSNMTQIQHLITHAFNQLHVMLVDVPTSIPADWLAHCLPRLFFWRATSLQWQSANHDQRQQLNTVFNLSEATLFIPIANAEFDITSAPALIRQANTIANTIAVLCQTQRDTETWLATMAPERFHTATADAARVLIRLQQGIAHLWPDNDIVLAISVFNGMLAILQSAQYTPATPSDVANLLIELLQPNTTDIIFDPCCGSGGLLCHIARHLQQAQDNPQSSHEIQQPLLIGEDGHPEAVALARLNLALHGWSYSRLEPRHHPELLGLRKENNQPLWADLVLAVLPAESQIGLAWHALESLHPERGRMALLLAPALLASHAGQILLQFLTKQNILHAVIELPEGSLPGRKYTPRCLLVDCRHATSNVAFISSRSNARPTDSPPVGHAWQIIQQAWQAHLTGGIDPNYGVLNSTTVRTNKAWFDALPFAAIWNTLRREYEGMEQQEQVRAAGIARTKRANKIGPTSPPDNRR